MTLSYAPAYKAAMLSASQNAMARGRNSLSETLGGSCAGEIGSVCNASYARRFQGRWYEVQTYDSRSDGCIELRRARGCSSARY